MSVLDTAQATMLKCRRDFFKTLSSNWQSIGERRAIIKRIGPRPRYTGVSARILGGGEDAIMAPLHKP
jgi:hypothetical protein